MQFAKRAPFWRIRLTTNSFTLRHALLHLNGLIVLIGKGTFNFNDRGWLFIGNIYVISQKYTLQFVCSRPLFKKYIFSNST